MRNAKRIKQMISFMTGIGAGDLNQVDLPISENYDEIDAVSATANMMRERLQVLNQEVANFQHLLELIPMMGFVLTAGGKVVRANTYAHSILGYPAGTLLGSCFGSLLEEGDAFKSVQFSRLVTAEKPSVQVFARLITANGLRLSVQLEVSRMVRPGNEFLVLARELDPEAVRAWLDRCARASQDQRERSRFSMAAFALTTQASVNPAFAELGITHREFEVLELFFEGLSVEEVATRLDRSYGTIQSHKEKLFTKFQVDKITLLLRRASDLQMIGKFRYGVDSFLNEGGRSRRDQENSSSGA